MVDVTAGRRRDSREPSRAYRGRSPITRVLLYLAAFSVLGAIIIPVVYAVVGGFRDTAQLASDPVGFPSPWIFTNYLEVLGSGSFWQQVWNSTLIALLTVALVIPTASLAAFVLARYPFRGREGIYALFTLGLLFPVTVAILPLFVVIRQFELLNTPFGVVLPQVAFLLPLSVVIMRPFFASIPRELEEAALLDGAGSLRFYWSVLIPLSRPVLSAIAVLTLVTSWNAFLLPLVVLTEATGWTLPLGVTNYSTQYTTDTARVLAYTTLAMVPALIFYAMAERQIVRGLVAKGIKG